MLFSLSNDQIAFLGIAAQLACAIGDISSIGLDGVFWLASAHMHVALDGIIILPLIFLGCVCYSGYRQAKEADSVNKRRQEDANVTPHT